MQKIVSVKATTLPDAWFQLVYNILEHGRDFKIDQGSFCGATRKEFDFIVAHITRPFERDSEGFPLIPEAPEGSNLTPPVDKAYLAQYAPYLLTGEIAEGESYTYGQRLNHEPISKEMGDEVVRLKGEIYREYCGSNAMEQVVYMVDKWISQVDLAIEVYKEYPRTNQMCLQVAKPSDIMLIDPPCLRHIDTRVQDGKLHFYPYFRSWDLYSGLPANLAGISMLQEHMANEIGIEQGEMICTSKGLHLYDYTVSFAEMRCMVGDACINGA
jgi:thymidylate synthase